MRSPAPFTNDARSSHGAESDTASVNQMQEDGARAAQSALFKTESDDEQDEQLELQRSPMPPQASSSATFAASAPSPPGVEPSIKRTWQTGGRQLLEQSRRRRPSLQQHLEFAASTGDERTLTANAASPTRHTSAGDFAEEIESEVAEIRTLIARTAQLWSAVDRAERAEDLPPVPQPGPQQPRRSFSVSAIQTRIASLPEQYVCVGGDEDSTLSSDEEEGEDEEADDTETESGGEMALQQNTEHSIDNINFVESLRRNRSEGALCIDRTTEQRTQVDEETVDEGHESEGTEEEGGSIRGGVQLEQDDAVDASNRAINASKARAIKNAMLGNLTRLGFRENITLPALEAGVLEIDHYDSDCELAYVDIFMSLVKMVCDAHVDVLNESGDIDQDWSSPGSENEDELGALNSDVNPSLEQRSFLPFKWPVFDMAQFEFGNARAGTCFNSVCVLTNLPKVSMDRTEELMEVLSCNLFCMIGDPIQVVIPSASSTGRTKGHAFLEFDDPDMAKRCASAVDGLAWGRGPFGRIRGNLFRQYQVKSPAEEQQRQHAAMSDRASLPSPFSGDLRALRSQLDADNGNVAHQHNLFCDSDDDSSDAGEWVVNRPIEYSQFNPSPLLDLSSGSVDIREQYESSQHAMHLDWDDEAFSGEYAMQMSSEGGGDEDDESFDSNRVLELQVPDEEDKAMDRSLFDELVHECGFNDGSRCSPARVSLSSGEAQESSTVASTASAAAWDALGECGVVEQAWEASREVGDGAEKPWRRYCEELIVRNREMQEQVAFARRRIVQLSHNNQKLHLLIDRVERDRDGLLFENDLLQTQLHGYEDHEQDHDSLMKELVTLRKRLKQKEHLFDVRNLDSHQHVQAACSSSSSLNAGSSRSIQSAFSLLSPAALASSKMEDLKEWEQLLESTLSRVRSAKEDKALEMQKKLDRQVEEQNELKLCVICLSNEKSILCLPCRHLCLCKTCSRRQEVAKCPICRLEIEEMLAVYS